MLTQNTLTEQACKYRGHPIELVTPNNAKWTCPINEQLAASDVTDTAVRIEEQTVLFLPTSEDSPNLQGASARLAGFEEILPLLDVTRDCSSKVTMDEKASRILERLEPPRAKKQRASFSKASTNAALAPASKQIKKPLLPREPSATQPLRSSFNRLKKKAPHLT
ncbi:ARM repeat superfamily protein [Zea mays]|uniref:ARM repeat superfamily protein n=1 Tax=Zea mays TaxID=4577 RepID=A0A1D6MNS7_MAIZE|nr:ARM repeat superfamily protein [Zea mays]